MSTASILAGAAFLIGDKMELRTVGLERVFFRYCDWHNFRIPSRIFTRWTLIFELRAFLNNWRQKAFPH
jgi:hypothetical protein